MSECSKCDSILCMIFTLGFYGQMQWSICDGAPSGACGFTVWPLCGLTFHELIQQNQLSNQFEVSDNQFHNLSQFPAPVHIHVVFTHSNYMYINVT